MKTIYDQTSYFTQDRDKIVDLKDFRRRMALIQRDSLARQPETAIEAEEPEGEEESGFCPLVLTMSRAERRRARRERQGWMLDISASLAIVLMTLVFLLRVML